jgi:signal transduction histidine kinase
MHVTLVSALVALALFLVAVLALALRNFRLRRTLGTANRMRAQAQGAEQDLLRRMRLAAHDVRGIGMTLHGHADQMEAAGDRRAAGIASAAADLMDMADDLQDHAVQPGTPRVLREEWVDLAAVLDEAIATVSAAILPGRRNWRVQGAVKGVCLRADLRALRHALTRVLTDAVRSTRDQDWIDIAARRGEDGWSLVVADEGAGTVASGSGAQPRDTRGIGLRLTLARALMEAHGGRLKIEAHAGVGTRVSLVLPAERLAAAARL